ncbi:MAG: hypothetical protein ACKV2O_23865 [Acidimicrobiales bacterium]
MRVGPHCLTVRDSRAHSGHYHAAYRQLINGSWHDGLLLGPEAAALPAAPPHEVAADHGPGVSVAWSGLLWALEERTG